MDQQGLTPPARSFLASQELLQRARTLIPGGYHLSGRPLVTPADSPMYFARGAGCRVWDVDGHEYIDYVMAFGPLLLGYAHEEVDRAAFEQARRGNLLTLNHPLHLRFVERLVARLPGADMGAFFKTGSDATTAALRLARRATGRRRVARCGYHGWHDWCLPLADFVPDGLERQVLEFRPDEPESLRELLRAHPGEVAAVILAPEMMPASRPELARLFAEHAREHGAVFILDEIKTGLRIRPGSFQQWAGVVPDLTTLSKALGNGWPVAAVVGRREVMRHGAELHMSATYHGETTGIAAALATLDVLDRYAVTDHVWRLGERLIAGLQAAVDRAGVPALAYGEPLPPMPFLRFTHADLRVRDAVAATFYTEMVQRGILLHPRHLWFVSAAHTDDDIDRTLRAAEAALAVVCERHPGALGRPDGD
ncbi:aspartate aminotransferase family protein [Nannocystis bainbridge]|uniref:Aminotransferase class III-fold pyridoxal phosphate-dependent enzyme n=1 Tax=Nannocystis bainbridge TaxID=2995303 RepID=A0ABT5DRM1_9BACT|nr:aminotransferase class III-fold pyridoxal phosphate-dependent enzyme [Nannocystis bainbridge]MDC0715704.1 aminotransferase class III-fold pyridoxal phosphate-dependent enzyme [Nannocystis bainbridge]